MSKNTERQSKQQDLGQDYWIEDENDAPWDGEQPSYQNDYIHSKRTRPIEEDNSHEYQDEFPLTPDQYNNPRPEQNYFSGRNNIINERMIRYQKRQLPPLQRYSPNMYKDAYAEFNQSYWDESPGRSSKRISVNFGAMWHKFIVTFASILSLVCLSWIAYNWNSNKQSANLAPDGIPVIEPERESFKVLPASPGGAEISYRDKTVYNRVDGGTSSVQLDERLLPPQEGTHYIPEQNKSSRQEQEVEEYSIINDKVYYIKLSAGKDKQILENEAKLLKKKHAGILADKECSVKRVSNSKGELQRAILVGPYISQKDAIDTAKAIGEQCYVISVRE